MNGVADVQVIKSEGFQDVSIKSRTLSTIRKVVDDAIKNVATGKIKLKE